MPNVLGYYDPVTKLVRGACGHFIVAEPRFKGLIDRPPGVASIVLASRGWDNSRGWWQGSSNDTETEVVGDVGWANACLESQHDDTFIYCQGFPTEFGAPEANKHTVEKFSRIGDVIWSIAGSFSPDGGGSAIDMKWLPTYAGQRRIVVVGSTFLTNSNPGSPVWNILIIDPDAGEVIQEILAPLGDFADDQLMSVAVDERDGSFVAVGLTIDTTENVFKYTPDSSGVYPDNPTWKVNTSIGDDAQIVMIVPDSGDVIIGVDYRLQRKVFDANYNMYVYEEDGTFKTRWRDPEIIWTIPGFPDDPTWNSTVDNAAVYSGFVGINGSIYYAGNNLTKDMYKIDSTYDFGTEPDENQDQSGYTGGQNEVIELDNDWLPARNFLPLSTAGRWACARPVSGLGVDCYMFVENDNSLEDESNMVLLSKFVTETGEALEPPLPMIRPEYLPRVLTKGGIHPEFGPNAKVDCEAFIKNSVPGFHPFFSDDTPLFPDLDYEAGITNVCGFEHFGWGASLGAHMSSAESSSIRISTRAGNYNFDFGTCKQGRFWEPQGDAGPSPFRTRHIGVTTDRMIFEPGEDLENPDDGAVYYRALSIDSTDIGNEPPNETYWEVVAKPVMKWDTYPQFGGIGYIDDKTSGNTTSPQVYTLLFKDVLNDEDGDLERFNGIYHCFKHYSYDEVDGANYSGGIYRYMDIGDRTPGNTGGTLDITFWLKLSIYNMSFEGFPLHIQNSTIVEAVMNNKTYWDITRDYSIDDVVKRASTGVWYICIQDITHDPEDPIDISDPAFWEVATEPEDESILKKTYNARTEEEDGDINNYGCVMHDIETDNENDDDTTFGHLGTVSFYPGKWKLWEARKVYEEKEVSIYDGDFYIANTKNKNEQPNTSGDWTIIETAL